MKILHRLFLYIQDLYVSFNNLVSSEIVHNTEKHTAIKKSLFYKGIEGIGGDYLEFGVYEGTSLKGAATYWKKIAKNLPMRTGRMKFYGFDSFSGMKPEKGDEHPFYTSFDFSTDFKAIKKRFSKFPEVILVPGFFQDTLKKTPQNYKINSAGIVMMDCDLYSSAKYAFNFLSKIVHRGTIFILDDYFNYLGGKKVGVRAAFEEFLNKNKIECEEISKYGIGGVVFLVTNIKK